MARKINKTVLVSHLINKLNDEDTKYVTLKNNANSLKIIDLLINRFGPLIVTTNDDVLVISRPNSKPIIDVPEWKVQSYCNDHGIKIYPKVISHGLYSLIIDRNGLIENTPGMFKASPSDKEEKWWKVVRILYDNEYINLKIVENEQKN